MDENPDTDFQLLGFPRIVDEGGLRSRAPFEVLATQFVDELRQGERPSIELYARRFPPHAGRIREYFPVLQLLEQARVDRESTSFRQNMPERFPLSRLGDCELLCELGRGGMGIVFQARDLSFGHIVAIKVLPWRVSIVPEWQQRFEIEARTAARLRHRNIVPVFRFGQQHGYCFYVMQFVNGIGLDRIIARLRDAEGVFYQDEMKQIEAARPAGFVSYGTASESHSRQPPPVSAESPAAGNPRLTRTSWLSFARIAMQAVQALRSAHSAGVLHNDLKPGNLLMDVHGRVWMTDFGLSQMISTPSRTRPTAVPGLPRLAGTLRYMAPERLLGNPPDARSDLYSLGVTLYELIVQQPAFTETDGDALINAVLDQTLPPPRAINPKVPADLETIVLNCMARDPEQRYPTPDHLLTDLLRFSAGDRVRSTRSGAVTEFLRTIRSRIPRAD